jgi:hypothetical protein
MAFCIGLWIRDTALQLRQQGIELNRKTLDNFGKGSGIYGSAGSLSNSGWTMQTGRQGNVQDEDLRWLL